MFKFTVGGFGLYEGNEGVTEYVTLLSVNRVVIKDIPGQYQPWRNTGAPSINNVSPYCYCFTHLVFKNRSMLNKVNVYFYQIRFLIPNTYVYFEKAVLVEKRIGEKAN